MASIACWNVSSALLRPRDIRTCRQSLWWMVNAIFNLWRRRSPFVSALTWHILLRRYGVLQGNQCILSLLGGDTNRWLLLRWIYDSQRRSSKIHSCKGQRQLAHAFHVGRLDGILLENLLYIFWVHLPRCWAYPLRSTINRACVFKSQLDLVLRRSDGATVFVPHVFRFWQ